MAHSVIVGRPTASDSLTYLLRGVSTPLFLGINFYYGLLTILIDSSRIKRLRGELKNLLNHRLKKTIGRLLCIILFHIIN
jgi:hypothetical protein